MIAVVSGLLKVVLIASIPYGRSPFAESRRDLERALAPLVRIPADELRPQPQPTLEFSFPTDPQWRRLVNKLGKPRLLMLANTQDDGRQPAYAAIDKRLTLHATQDGRPLAIALTSGMPWGLQPSPGATGYQFAAAANQIITLSILMNDGAVATRPWS